MTVSPQSLLITLQGIQNEPQLQNEDKLTIQILLNSTKLSLLDITSPNSSCSIPDISPSDIVQIVLMEHHKQEWFGSVSFLLDSFLECKQRKFSQWVTLSKDSNDDLFDSNFPFTDKQAPRLRLCFDFSADAPSVSDKTSEIGTVSSQLPRELPREEVDRSISEYESSSGESEKADIRIHTDEGSEDNKCYTLRMETDDKITAHLRMIKSSFKDTSQSPLSFRVPSGLLSARGGSPYANSSRRLHFTSKLDNYELTGPTIVVQKDESSVDLEDSSISMSSNSPKESQNPVTNLKKAFANEFALLSDKLKQADSLKKNAKELKEILTRRDSEGFNLGPEERATQIDSDELNTLKNENEGLNTKLQETLAKLQTLEDENRGFKERETRYTEKLDNVSNELEQLRIGAVNHERIVNELQNELLGVQEQVKEEIQLRVKLQGENEALEEALNKLKEDSQNLEKEIHARNMRDKLNIKMELVQAEPFCLKKLHQPQQRFEDSDIVVQESAPITQRTEMNEEGIDADMEAQVIDGVSFAGSMVEPITIEEVETLYPRKLDLKKADNPSKTDKLIIDSMMSQIKHLQSYVKSLESEKEDLKDELFRSNENYSKLTTKYIELTEILANGASEVPKQIHTARAIKTEREIITPRTPRTPHATLATLATETDDDGEVQVKLNEFLTVNKISPSLFVRVDKNIYMFNDKKVSLQVLHKRLIAKVNGNFQTIEEFWRTYKAKERTKTPTPLTKLAPNSVRSNCGTPDRRHSQSISLVKLGSKRPGDKAVTRDRLDSARSEIPRDLFEANTPKENVKVKDVAAGKFEEKRRKIASSNLKERVKKI